MSNDTQTSESEIEENQEQAIDTVPATQKFIELNGRKFILVGTAHVSAQSVEEVKNVIREQHPDSVAIELDQKRLESMEDPEAWRKMDIIKVLKNKQGFLMIANLVLSSYQKRMGTNSGIKPGDEMMAAITTARELNIPQVMVDRPIAVTLRRAWAINSFWGKMKLLSSLAVSAFSKEEVDPEQIEKLKQSSEMDSMMSELSDYMPKVKEVLIDERDRYLASHIWESQGESVLAVLGAGHLPGVESWLKKLASGEAKSDCTDISSVPPASTASKILAWVLPALVIALIVVGFVFGGRKTGFDLVWRWVFYNGVFAGIGGIIAGAHPITILVAVLTAPFTSLCPFIGVGMVTGIVQASINKPKVEDMENIQKDVSSIKGFYKNRILRILWIFLWTTIGSTVGTILAGTSFVVTIKKLFGKIVAFFKGGV